MKKLSFILFLLIYFFNKIFSAPDSSGKKFWITFPSNIYNTTAQKFLYITSQTNATGNVYIANPAFNLNFSISPGAVTIIALPFNCEMTLNNDFDYKGIRILSNNKITVYGISKDVTITDAFLALPVEGLGTNYIIQGYKNNNYTDINFPQGGSQFAIVGTEDNTQVTFILPIDTLTYIAGVPYNFTLNEGQVFRLRNDNLSADLSGTIINSNKRIAVFGSHHCANIPSNTLWCDYLIEQLQPTTTWGKHFVLCPLYGRNNGDTYRFTSVENNTNIYLDGNLLVSLNANQFFEVIIDGAGYITSNNRIMVIQYANSTDYDNMTGDPCMIMVPPIEQYLKSYTVFSPVNFANNYINIMAPLEAAGNITIDGWTIPYANYNIIGTSGYSFIRLSVSPGPHNITSDYYFTSIVYGFDFRESYGYPAGMGLEDFISTPTPTVTPTITMSITRTITITRTQTNTRTMTLTATFTITFTQSVTPTQQYPTLSNTQTVTPLFTNTIYILLSLTATETLTISNTITQMITSTKTSTFSPTYSITNTATCALTPFYTATPTFTFSYTSSITLTPTETFTRTISVTPTNTMVGLTLKLSGIFTDIQKGTNNIVFWLSKNADVTVKIFTVSGEIVIIDEKIKYLKGYNVFFWDKKNKYKKDVASGIYIFKIFAETNKNEKAEVIGKLYVIK
ncbi:MAG: hypothetical protein N2114_02970 [Candidatus Goldbacteria bacterium]|nr:hypothetical protein [Candidatus Goldiibacteriota bacterium]